jgi:hypothetical protein
MGWDPATPADVARRTAEGLGTPEILRCPRRDLARQLDPLLAGHPAPDPATLGPGGPRSGPPTTLQPGGAAVTRRAEAERRAPPPAGLTAAGGGATASPRRPPHGSAPLSATP